MSAPPAATPRTSALAVASLAVGLFMCVPFLGLVAAALAGGAIVRIRSSEGRLTGGAFAVAALAMGLFNLVGSTAMAWVIWREEAAPAPAPIAAAPPPAAPPAAPPGADEGGQMTTINEITEVQVGAVRLVDIPPTKRSLDAELAAQIAAAAAAKEKVVLFTVSEGCRPCTSIAAILPEPRMQAALAGVRLLRVDINLFGPDLEDLGIPPRAPRGGFLGKVPGFFLLGKQREAVDGIHGGEWDDDTADNAAPVLESFVKRAYKKRREVFRPNPRRAPSAPPKPSGTFL